MSIQTQQTEVLQVDNTTNESGPYAAKPQDAVMTNIIGWILLGGVLVSSAIILLGIVLLPFRPGGIAISALRVETFPHTIGQVWSGIVSLHPQAIIVLGLLLLIATPVLRVAVSIIAFALEHDRRYVVITCIVLGILILGFFLGKGGA